MHKSITAALAASALVAVSTMAEDQGAAIAAAAQGESSAVSVPPEQFVSASDKVRENLGRLGVPEGYDPAKKSIVVVGSAYLAAKDLNVDKMFMTKRSAKAMEAYLNAKAEIIRAFSMNFSAAEQISMQAEFGDSEEEAALAAEIDGVQERVADFARKANAPAVADAPFDDTLVAALKDIDAAKLAGIAASALVDPAGTVGKAVETAVGAAASGGGLAAERDRLVSDVSGAVAKANAVPRQPVNESTSAVSLLSKMPLLGATVLTQAESWDRTDGVYEIAMAVLWSPKLQEEAKALASGNPAPSEKNGRLSAQEWVARQDLLAVVGPRRFTDKDGNAIVVGVAARDLAGIPVVKMKPAKQLADTDAMKYVATSLLCDLEAFREAKQGLAEYADDTSKATESISDKIASKTELQLSGVLRLGTKEGLHPISGRKTYAVAYYLAPDLSRDAMERIKKLYADAVTVENATKFRRGQLAGMEEKLDEARKSDRKFQEGKAEGAAAVTARVKADEAKARVSGPQGSSGVKQGAASGGAVSGDNLDTVDLDF